VVKNAIAAIIYRIALVFVAGYGLADGFGILAGRPDFCQFAYFTDVSNILCFLYFLVAILYGVVCPRRSDGPQIFLPRVKGAVTLSISITLLVNHFVLCGTPFLVADGHFDLANLFAHYLVPIMVILDLILFDRKGGMRPVDPILYALIPFAYLLYIFVRAKVGGPIVDGQYYPYPFLDISVLGVAAVARNIAMLSLAFFAVAYAGYAVDRIVSRQQKRRIDSRKPADADDMEQRALLE
jgi:hypothetical protein